MFSWTLAILSAILMLGLEYLFLIRVYDKTFTKPDFSALIIPPILLILAQYITYRIQDNSNAKMQTLNPFILFLVIVVLKLPFSLFNHDIVKNISLLERLIITGVEAVSVTIIAEGLLVIFRQK